MGKLYYVAYFKEIIHAMRGIEAHGSASGTNGCYEFDVDDFGEKLLENQEFIMAAKEYGFSENDIKSDPFKCLAEVYYGGEDVDCIDPFRDLAGLQSNEDWSEVTEAYTSLAKPKVEKAIKEIKEYADEKGYKITDISDHSIEFEIDDTVKDEVNQEIFQTIIWPKAKSICGDFYNFYEKHTHTFICSLCLSEEWVEDFMILE